jgi:hypothetical protein
VEDALDLAPVDALIGIDPVGNFRQVAGPDMLPVEQHHIVAAAAAHSAVRTTAAHIASDAPMQRHD